MMRESKINSGFTIIEIIVAIGLISILVSISYAGYATFSQRQKLISSGQTLKNTLRDVQSRSFNNETDCNICNCTDPNLEAKEDWYVDLANMQFYGQCQGNNFTVTSLRLDSDISINTNNTLLQFAGDPPRVNTDSVICMSLAGLIDKYYRIDVSRSGDISDSGGLVQTCTP